MTAAGNVVRIHELTLLKDAVYDPAAPGRVIAVIGDPGSGKSHLLAALVKERLWSEHPAAVHQCSQRGTGSAMDAVRRLLRRARHSAEPDATEESVSRVSVRRSVRELVVLDDTHLADPATLAEICDMATGVSQPLVDVVIALRPRQTSVALDEALTQGALYGQAVRVELRPLTDRQLLALSDPPAPQLLRRRSAGNPFSLRALQALEESAGLGSDAAVTPFELAVMRETRDLTPNERSVLYAAAVLRSRFDRALLSEVAEVDPLVVCAAVERLKRRDLLRGDGERLSLRDEVFGTLLHRTIEPCWSQRAHQRALHHLSERGRADSDLGFHLVNSLTQAEEAELARIVSAATDAVQTDVDSAIAWLTSVIAEAPPGSEVGLRARLALSRALGQVGRMSESRELLFVVYESGRIPRAEMADEIARVATVEGALSYDLQALDLLYAQLRVPGASGEPTWPRLVLALHVRRCLSGRPGLPEMLVVATERAQAQGDNLTVAGLLGIHALDAIMVGAADTARADLTAAVELLDRCPEHTLVHGLPALLVVGLAYVYLGGYDQARRHLSRAVTVAGARQHTYLLPALFALLSEASRHLGQLQQAYEAADNAIVESPAGNDHRHAQAVALKSLAEVWRQPVESGRAKLLGQQALALQPHPMAGYNACASIAALTLAKLAWLGGDPNHCVTLLLNEGRGADLSGIPAGHRAVFWELMCAAALDAGLPMREWVARSEAHAARFPFPHHLAYVDMARGHAERAAGAVHEAVAHYDRAAAAFAAADMLVEQGYALGQAVRALTGAGQAASALDRLALAKEIAHRCAAPALLDWVCGGSAPERADDAGSTDRQIPMIGDLTQREREIALLVSSGLKRRDIATRLLISTRTVDVHLTRIYRKTGMRSRVELALALARRAG